MTPAWAPAQEFSKETVLASKNRIRLKQCKKEKALFLGLLTLQVQTSVVVVIKTAGAVYTHDPLLAWTLPGRRITHTPGHGSTDVAHTRQAAQRVPVLQSVVTRSAGVAATALRMFLT